MILAILQSRMSSSRLPGKVLKPILNKPIVAYEIERIKQSKKIDKIVLATSINEDDNPLEELAKSLNIECFRGDLENVLKRYYDCATHYKADIIVRLTGDCPVIDPTIIDEIIESHLNMENDYTSNTLYRTFPDGLDVEVFNYETLKKVYENAVSYDEKEHVTLYIHKNKDKFKIGNFQNDIDYSYLRWTLDTIDDFYFFKRLYETKKTFLFNWKEILSFTKDERKYLIDSNQTIRYAMKKLEEIIADEMDSLYVLKDTKIIGTLSTSDIRRALIYEDITNNDQVIKVMNSYFHYLEKGKNYTRDELKKLKKYKILPILDEERNLIEFKSISDLLSYKNKVILMAGGLGSRLKDLTLKTPKPMLKIAGKPILEIIMDQFKNYYYKNFYISLNYKAEQISDYFENGEKFDANISYIYENKKMGTIGCLSLIQEEFNEPFFVMNGDILTNVNFEEMMNYHISNNNEITIATIKKEHNIPYGVIESDNNKVLKIEEKPTYKYNISAGIYILNSNLIKEIPLDYYDITSLFDKLLRENRKIGVYEIKDYWIDIGHPEDFYKAREEYNKIFNKEEK
jgi:spore coat polysaccharide biosynthesis protein SpsF (cytidylyltransferase family)/UTP-glucose-1-phosphate uridylyltransferase